MLLRITLIIAALMIPSSTVARAQTAAPSGATIAWTSDDPTLAEIKRICIGGGFPSKELVAKLDERSDDLEVQRAREEMKEVLRRMRQEYGLTPQQLLEKVKGRIPDVTANDLERWREAGQLQHRMIDGQVAYFRREPSNLLRFCDEAKQRCGQEASTGQKFVLTDHLAKVIEEAQRTGRAEVTPVRHRIQYKVTVPANPARAKKGSLLRVWLPFPQECRQQSEVKLISAAPADPRITANGVKDGRILANAQRTAYFEKRLDDPAKSNTFEITFEYVSHAYYPTLTDEDARPLPADFDKAWLAERAPHILFTPELKQAVAKVVGDETNPLARARKIFHHVDSKIRYCAEEEYCLIPSFSTKALSSQKGDCGIQSILFITMCRAAGIPARWQSGWETKPSGWNMHDWTEFYVEPWGWLPADPSYGLQKSDRADVREFYFGHQDSYRLIVNLDYGSPLVPAKQSLRSEPADFQRGEVELDGRNLYFDEWGYDIQFEWEQR
jgi:transglutaminase-like putative cysteine protease